MARKVAVPAKESPYRPIPVNKYGGVAAKERQIQRRERLIAAGFKLFATNGFANTSIQTLAESANCALRTFYEEFGTREALLLEMYDRTITAVLQETLEALALAGRGRAAFIRAGVDAYVRAMTRDPAKARIALIEVVGVNREIDKRRRDAIKSFVQGIEAAVAPRRRDGTGPNVEDLDIVLLALAGASDVLVTEWLVTRGRLSVERLASVLYGLWLRGLRLE
jgi:AcrR family transcriptional regulator